ncbi:CIC family chloride channel protein [Methanofollis sp. W23]|uniref:chloride channel protein n=1 Tax=Methanofollis sp. W23 TaxID=2817849 RepID=UPI001AE5D103|nr:chloride channel protein [Methanofollis sp. W23]MBP2144676.1 CIC family chloride channel protein [Methanofollis sp. W23]
MSDSATPFQRIFLIAVIVGVISGVGALLFFEALKIGTRFCMGTIVGFQIPEEGQTMAEIALWSAPQDPWLILPVICLGGLLSGLLVYTYAPEAEGHGTDAAVKAFHGEGRIRHRIPLLKALTAVITISTGGSAGREGPTAQMSAGFGSMVADYLGLSERERRIAIATGIGAGIGTIFKAPLGGAILAAEVLYTRDFEAEAIVPGFLASVIGYAIFGSVEGFEPVFFPVGVEWTVAQIPLFLFLGVVCAGAGLLYIRTFYGTKRVFATFFERHHLPKHIKPLSGAFLTGLLVVGLIYLSPETAVVGLAGLGTGYGFIQLALYSMLPLSVLLFIPLVKILTTSLTIGSGGSGGVFAPGLVIGAATGGAVGSAFHLLAPSYVPPELVPGCVVVGMIAFFGAISNAPIAVMIMVVEMTGNFSLFVPAMGAVAVAYVLTGEETIFVEQVRTKAQSRAHRGEYEVDILEGIRVRDVMIPRSSLIALAPGDTCRRVLDLVNSTEHTGYPVLEGDRIVGIITTRDVRAFLATGDLSRPVNEAMSAPVVTVPEDHTLEEALQRMMEHDIHHLPVVAEGTPGRLVGFITRTDLMLAHTRHLASGGRA